MITSILSRLQSQWDHLNADNRRIENYSITEQRLKETGNKALGKYPEGLPHKCVKTYTHWNTDLLLNGNSFTKLDKYVVHKKSDR